MKNSFLSITVLTLCALYSITPLLIHNEFISGGWDLSHHINKAFHVSKGIKEGVIYPRWLAMSNGGYGNPTMIFYSPLFYWITGFINLFLPSLIASLKVTTFMGFFLSGISMYIFLRNFCNHTGSVAGGIAYQILPYHIFDFYIRDSLAETFAFLWLPLILHFLYTGVIKDRLSHWIGMSLSYAGLILTHIASAYIFTFVIVAAALSLSIREKSAKGSLKFVVATVFGLLISSVYFLPMFFERRFIHLEWLVGGHWGTYASNFLFVAGKSRDPFYLCLGKIVMMQVLLVIVSLIHIYYRSKRNRDFSQAYLFIFSSSVFIFSIFMSTSYSTPVWKIIPGLPTILFPWRWLMVSTFAISILIALTFHNFSIDNFKRDRVIRIYTAVFLALIISNLYLSSSYITAAEPMQKNDLERILREAEDHIEYRPIWLIDTEKDFSRDKGAPVIFKEGTGTVDILIWRFQSRMFKVNASAPSTLRVSTFYYPGWTALVNDREVPIDIEKDSGAMLLNLPTGKNTVLLEFRDTSLRKTAKWISVLSLSFAIACLIVPRFNLKTSNGR